jgi:hypothetical protein
METCKFRVAKFLPENLPPGSLTTHVTQTFLTGERFIRRRESGKRVVHEFVHGKRPDAPVVEIKEEQYQGLLKHESEPKLFPIEYTAYICRHERASWNVMSFGGRHEGLTLAIATAEKLPVRMLPGLLTPVDVTGDKTFEFATMAVPPNYRKTA